MPIYNEVWDQNDYFFRNKVNLQNLPANHLMKLDSLKFDFVEYKANQLVACHAYERMHIHCNNQYGSLGALNRLECLDVKTFFDFCVKLNAGYGYISKYHPETLLTNPYSRPQVNLNEIK